MSKLHRSRLDTSFGTRRSGSSQLASDKTLSRIECFATELHCKPTRSVDQLCEMCPSSSYIPRHTARMTSVSTPSSTLVQEAVKRTSLLRDNMIAEIEGLKPRKKKAPPQPTTVYNTVPHPVRRSAREPSLRVSPITRRWRLFVVSILQTERIRVRRENALMMEEDLRRRCRDAWHGNFSEARRWSMLVSQRIFKRCWMR